jgi:hypothetical protein
MFCRASIICVLFVSALSAQRSDSLVSYRNQLKVSPVIITAIFTGFNFSYERSITNKYSLMASAAYINGGAFYKKQLEGSTMAGRGFGLEQKYFLKNKGTLKWYVSNDFTWRDYQWDKILRFVPSGVPLTSYNNSYGDSVRISKLTFDINIRGGLQFFFKRLLLEYNTGFGLRYRDVSFTGQLRSEDELYAGRHQIFLPYFWPGKYYIPVGASSIRIGIAF